MKTAMLAHTVPQSGLNGISIAIARFAYYIPKHLRSFGHDATLFIRDDFNPKEKWIKTIPAPKKTWVPYPIVSSLKLRNVKSDVWHSDYVTTGAALSWAKKSPLIVSMHDAIPFTYKKSELTVGDRLRVKWYMRCFKSIKNADAVTVASNHAKKEVLKYTSIPEEKLFTIPFGFDPRKFYPVKKKKTSKGVKIGYVGGLDGRKNVDLLLEAFEILVQENNSVELHLGGAGRNLEKFKAMKIPNTFFHGRISPEKVPEFLRTLDIFVFPTLLEGFGLPAIEAAACGLPVVGCNVATMPEIFGKSAALVEPHAELLAEKLEKLSADSKFRKKVSARCFEISGDYTWEKISRKTLDLYNLVKK